MLNDSKIGQLNSERPLHQTAVQGYFMKRVFIHFISWANFRHVSAEGAPKNSTTVFARKISKGIDKLFDDPKLVAQKFSMLSTIPKNQQLCLYFSIPGSAVGAFAKVRSIYYNMEAPTLIFYCFFTAFCKKS